LGDAPLAMDLPGTKSHQLVGNSRHAVFGARESDQIGESGSAFFGMMDDAGPNVEQETVNE